MKGGMEALGKQAETSRLMERKPIYTHKAKSYRVLTQDVRNIRYIEAYTKSEECRIAALYELQDVSKVPHNHEVQT